MNAIKYVLLLTMVTLVAGCATTVSDRLTNFHEARPTSILVVPPVNTSTDVQATTSVLATLPYYLAEKGFYVYPVNTVKTLLELEGFYEPAEIHALPPQELAELFQADTVLYITIHEWTAKYLVFSTVTEVELGYKLLAADGTVLWEERLDAQYSPNSSGGGDFASLLISAIEAAAERASPNYIPLTRMVHSSALQTPAGSTSQRGIPLGPYHPSYELYYEQVQQQQ